MLELFASPLVRMVCALALLLGGAALVRSTLHFRRDKIAARVGLIDLSTNTTIGAPEQLSRAMDDAQQDAKLTKEQREFARGLRGLGVPARFAPAALIGAQALCALSLAFVCWSLAPGLALAPFRVLSACAGGALGWFLPALAARRMATHRAAAVVAGLPDALELLVICAEGGLSLGDGINRIVKQLERTRPELADELASTAADLKMLPTQDLALARLAARVDVPIVQSVVTTLGQTMRYGTPFAKAVRVMATEMRNDSLVRLEARANSLPTFLTISMILFILPTVMIIVAGPAALQVWDAFFPA